MIPDLAIIISAFVITSMARLILKEPKEHGAVAALAALTILATVICLVDILARGGQIADQLKGLGLPK